MPCHHDLRIALLHRTCCMQLDQCKEYITLTSWWPRWRLKSPASRLFTQSFIRAQIEENIKAPRHWPLRGEFTGTGEFLAQRASNAENVSIWWLHHERRKIEGEECNFVNRSENIRFWIYQTNWTIRSASIENHTDPPTLSRYLFTNMD